MVTWCKVVTFGLNLEEGGGACQPHVRVILHEHRSHMSQMCVVKNWWFIFSSIFVQISEKIWPESSENSAHLEHRSGSASAAVLSWEGRSWENVVSSGLICVSRCFSIDAKIAALPTSWSSGARNSQALASFLFSLLFFAISAWETCDWQRAKHKTRLIAKTYASFSFKK